jgi:hypothetical protein
MSIAMETDGATLSTCGVTPDGETICRDLVDSSGRTVSLRLPFD